jgi:hypothetical protein
MRAAELSDQLIVPLCMARHNVGISYWSEGRSTNALFDAETRRVEAPFVRARKRFGRIAIAKFRRGRRGDDTSRVRSGPPRGE